MCNPDSQSGALHASEPGTRGLLDTNTDETRLKPARLIMCQHYVRLWRKIWKEIESKHSGSVKSLMYDGSLHF